MDSTPTPRLASLGLSLPEHYADQASLTAAFRRHWHGRHFNLERLEQLHRATQVEGRHLAVPPERYPELDTFAKRNDVWIEVAADQGERALRRALDQAGLEPKEIDHLFFATISGLSVPSLDATLANRLGMRPDLKRTPLFGLGCVAGAAALARATDYLRAYPDEVAAVLSVELCSLTLQHDDLSMANLVATGLFGDGAAAAVLVGANRSGRGPRVLATDAVQYPDTEWVMGWKIGDGGFQVVLSAEVPNIAREHLRQDVDRFLSKNRLNLKDIRHFIFHPGGPKVLEAIEEALEVTRDALAPSWEVLRAKGNLSSATVLFVLEQTMRSREPRPGELGILGAMGPGFCSQLVLLQW